MQRNDGTWGEIGAGFRLPVSANAAVYARGNYRHSLTDGDSSGYNVSGGVRIEW